MEAEGGQGKAAGQDLSPVLEEEHGDTAGGDKGGGADKGKDCAEGEGACAFSCSVL